MRIPRWLVALAAIMALFAWSLQPVSYKFAIRQSNGTLVDATESTAGARPVFGSSSHILPLVRVVNAVAEPFKRRLIPLDVEAMTRMAVDMIGHDDDFGDPDFGDLADWEAFARLVQVADERCHLFGRFVMKQTFISILATNLKIQKLLKENPEIEREVIDRPVILAAFTRTGATFLYQVLADIYKDELTPTYSYEIFGGPLELSDPPQRLENAEAALSGLGALNPPMKLLHEWISAEEPEDEPGWYLHSLTGLVVPFQLPSEWHHARIYEPASQERNLRLWETLNKIRQWQAGKKQRFLLKAPEHLFGLPQLVQDHPDASIITVSRDEKSWYPSSLVMTQLSQYMFVDAQVEDTIAFTDRLLCGQRRSLEVAHNGSYDLLPVRFGSYLFEQTFEVVERIANHANLTWDQDTQARANDVITKRLAWKNKAYYKIDEFGLSRAAISERLKTVCDHLPEPN